MKAMKELSSIIIDIIFNIIEKEIKLIKWIQKMPNKNRTVMRWNFGNLSDFKPLVTYTKVITKEI